MLEHDSGNVGQPEQSSREKIGLNSELLAGKAILDVHGETKTFGELPGVNITAINPERPFGPEELPFEDKLPFKDGIFDMVTGTSGLFCDDPAYPEVMALYQEAVRVLKPDGELRVLNPYQPEGTKPEGWTPAEEMAFLFYNEGVDVSVTMVPSENNSQSSYLVLKKKLPSTE